MYKRYFIQALVSFILMAGSNAQAGDWPMWKYDSGRTAASPHALPKNLQLHWVRELPQARQAWRDKSNQKLFFDTAYEPIVAGKLMFVSSMNIDSVTAYSTETGAETWRFYTDGPVRFAPVAYKGKLYAGSDDGYLYCLNALTGKLIWKKRGGPADHKILGNRRLIGMWPFRGGPVIHNGVLYCAAGMWPFMGTFIYALDPATGKEIWVNSGNGSRWMRQPHANAESFAGIAPQGYVVATDDMLLVPSGRRMPGGFNPKTGEFIYAPLLGKQGFGGYSVSAKGGSFACWPRLFSLKTGEFNLGRPNEGVMTLEGIYTFQNNKLSIQQLSGGPPSKIVTLPQKVGGSEIKAGDTFYTADGKNVFAIAFAGDKATVTPLQGETNGMVHRMLAADDRLFVVDKAGSIFCFGPGSREVVKHPIIQRKLQEPKDANPAVDAVVKNCTDLNGYCVVMGADTDVIRGLLSRTELHVIVVDSKPETVGDFRKELAETGLYGKRVTAFVAGPFAAGLPPYLANALVLTQKIKLDAGKLSALFEVLRPYGGLAVLPASGSEVMSLVKTAKLQKAKALEAGSLCLLTREGSLPGSASWTHQYADAGNSVTSKDKLVKPPFGLLWFGGTTNDSILPRHGHGPNPHVVGGRIFIEGMDILRSVDVYTGRLLWERELKGLGYYYNNTEHHPGANEIGSNYVSLEDAVYVLYKEKCLKMDPATGKTIKEFTLPPGKEGVAPILGSIRVEGDYLVLTAETLGISSGPELVEVKGGKNIILEDATGITINSGKGITIVEPGRQGKNYGKKFSVIYTKMKQIEKGNETVYVGSGQVKLSKTEKLLKIDRFQNLQIAYCKKITIAEGQGITVMSAKNLKLSDGAKINVPYASGSRTLAVLDRHSGKVRWSRQAYHGFRHNAVIAAGNTVYCLDKLSLEKESFYKRRGLTLPGTPSLLALDIQTGKVNWKSEKDIFGTWLGYNSEHDILIQAGAAHSDRPKDEVGTGITAYRGKDGQVIWKDLERPYGGPLLLRHQELITNGRGGTGFDLLTGKPTGWSWERSQGCNTAIAGEHILTYRSGSASFYDLNKKGGTANLGGFKSGCSSNILPADGVLAVPDYTRTCTCSYPNQTSLGLRHMPAVEIWTYTPMETAGRRGINFGAPGSRVSSSGTLWTQFPLEGSPAAMKIREEGVVAKRKVTADGKGFRHHSNLFTGETETWIGSSGIEGVTQVSVEAPGKGPHTVRLYFAEPDRDATPGSRVFDVTLAGKKVLSSFDVLAVSNGTPRTTIVKELKGIEAKDGMATLQFKPLKGTTLISGIELILEGASGFGGGFPVNK